MEQGCSLNRTLDDLLTTSRDCCCSHGLHYPYFQTTFRTEDTMLVQAFKELVKFQFGGIFSSLDVMFKDKLAIKNCKMSGWQTANELTRSL